MIAAGRVGLYIDADKHQEKQLEIKYGHLRSKHYEGSDEDLKGLGENALTLHVSLLLSKFIHLLVAIYC
jgi:hypothetical protein